VEAFFCNLDYVVKKTKEISFYHKDIPSLFQNTNLKALVLPEIIVVFEPPDNLDSIIKQLNSKRWTLVPRTSSI
jgi:hypothetical protein